MAIVDFGKVVLQGSSNFVAAERAAHERAFTVSVGLEFLGNRRDEFVIGHGLGEDLGNLGDCRVLGSVYSGLYV